MTVKFSQNYQSSTWVLFCTATLPLETWQREIANLPLRYAKNVRQHGEFFTFLFIIKCYIYTFSW